MEHSRRGTKVEMMWILLWRLVMMLLLLGLLLRLLLSLKITKKIHINFTNFILEMHFNSQVYKFIPAIFVLSLRWAHVWVLDHF